MTRMRWVVVGFVAFCFAAMAASVYSVRAKPSCGCKSPFCNAATAPQCTNCCGDPPKQCSMHPEGHAHPEKSK